MKCNDTEDGNVVHRSFEMIVASRPSNYTLNGAQSDIVVVVIVISF